MTTVEIDLDKLEPVSVICTEVDLCVTVSNGQTIVTPLWWYPRLQAASPVERAKVELTAYGVHWPDIDEDLSVEGMIKGWRSKDAMPPDVAA